jgi:starch synthase (maltosyl-transferring)
MPTEPPPDPGLGRPGGLEPPPTLAGRFAICEVWPAVESGRRPAKAAVGEKVPVAATVFREGHDALGVEAVLTSPTGSHHRISLHPVGVGMDRWAGDFRFEEPGDWTFSIEAWDHVIETWLHRARIKIPIGSDREVELGDGALLLERVADSLPDEATAERTLLLDTAEELRDDSRSGPDRLALVETQAVTDLLTQYPLRDHPAQSPGWPIRVERRRALVGSWYEMFPRSEGASVNPPKSGTFAQAAQRLPAIADMGFDVVYLPPVHPIGHTNRKGRNNTTDPAEGDPGSPWAIGDAAGGHDAVHPDLGTLADLDDFIARARELEMEVALDLALQATPDHPWVAEHPDWFAHRADGSIAYAENPPKKYQDIYPLYFDDDPDGLYAEILRVARFWIDRGVRILRVDNPHTKPLWLWDRLIAEINATDPDVIFLAEAFTRPAMMRALATVGFQQSYSYFTWRNHKDNLTEYLEELSGPASAYMRPNFFPSTPDILPAFLQHGGPAAFAVRATLAATMSPSWGIYSGFELFEYQAIRPGSEEYLDSEKYQYRPRDWVAAQRHGHTLIEYVTMLNQIRRSNPALQALRNIHFHHADDADVIAFSKSDAGNTVIVVCNLDPHWGRETTVHLDMAALGHQPDDQLQVTDLVTGAEWTWHRDFYVKLVPQQHVAHIARVHG